jgi:NAD(P)H dehydrogenase (quinone)
MTKVLILYYSAYGHMERMAQAVAEGVRDAGVESDIKRVPELVSEEVAKQSGFKLDQKVPIATIAELANYDAIIFGFGTRFALNDPYASPSRYDRGRASLLISGAEHNG